MIENSFDAEFTTRLSLKEKQIQQSYRPVIGIHKWFARRPGSVFRSLLLSEFLGDDNNISEAYFESHDFTGTIADPFMGGGTPIYEANRLGFNVVGTDINPVAFWVVRQALESVNIEAFKETAHDLARKLEAKIGDLYVTKCPKTKKYLPVKYFFWVKVSSCPTCKTVNDLFPGYLLAQDVRHPKNVVICRHCDALNEWETVPTKDNPQKCPECAGETFVDRTIGRGSVTCNGCTTEYKYQLSDWKQPIEHRLFALEYHDPSSPKRRGRLFKRADKDDKAKFEKATKALKRRGTKFLPDEDIPVGDETKRLFRWGYKKFIDLFNHRQRLVLSLLMEEITKVQDHPVRHALFTVFSDFLRYQNMLCRYDTYALKCQDIFSVHGFPVGLIQCENNVIGIPKVGSGAFIHFIEKYLRAKAYCDKPFETSWASGRKRLLPIEGESIKANLVKQVPKNERQKQKWGLIRTLPAWKLSLKDASLDGVFTDPPYFNNVQYAELMDFCYVWLKRGLASEFPEFSESYSGNTDELTGNKTTGKGLEHFTNGLSRTFRTFAKALKPNAPFVFTYHHNDPVAYAPLIVAILDANMSCTATLPVAAEMTASMHIAGTGSSILDSVFICRKQTTRRPNQKQGQFALLAAREFRATLDQDVKKMTSAGVKVTEGDKRCLAAGHVARLASNVLAPVWDSDESIEEKLALAKRVIGETYSAVHDSTRRNEGKKDETAIRM